MTAFYIPTQSEILEVAHSHGQLSDAPDLWNKLELFLPMNEPGGNICWDMSGKRNHGTMTNMDPATDRVVTERGRALIFAAGAEYVLCSGGVLPSSTEWSLSAWARHSGTDQGYMWCDSGNVANLLGQWAGVDGMQFYVDNILTSQAVVSDAWHLWNLVLQGTGATIYLDGQVWNTLAGLSWTGMAGSLMFGNRLDGERDWIGWIGSAYAHSRAVLPYQIQQLYEDPWVMGRMRRKVFAAAVAPATYRRRIILAA